MATITADRRALILILDAFCCRMWHEGWKRMVHWRDADFVSEQFVGQISTPLLDAANHMRKTLPQLIWVGGRPLTGVPPR